MVIHEGSWDDKRRKNHECRRSASPNPIIPRIISYLSLEILRFRKAKFDRWPVSLGVFWSILSLVVSIGLLGVSLSIYFSCTIELILINVNIQKKKMMVHLNQVRVVEWFGIFIQSLSNIDNWSTYLSHPLPCRTPMWAPKKVHLTIVEFDQHIPPILFPTVACGPPKSSYHYCRFAGITTYGRVHKWSSELCSSCNYGEQLPIWAHLPSHLTISLQIPSNPLWISTKPNSIHMDCIHCWIFVQNLIFLTHPWYWGFDIHNTWLPITQIFGPPLTHI